MFLLAAGHPLVHLNAALNSLSTLLLLLGLFFIKQRWERAHQNAMLGALVTSAAFLCSYLYYHIVINLTVHFTHPGVVKVVYLVILASHILLAMTVPYFALAAGHYGWWALHGDPALAAKRRAKHRRIVRFGYPIWLYVSVTGVIVYLMLYHLWPSAELTETTAAGMLCLEGAAAV